MQIFDRLLKGIAEGKWDELEGQAESRQTWFFQLLDKLPDAGLLTQWQRDILYAAWVEHRAQKAEEIRKKSEAPAQI